MLVIMVFIYLLFARITRNDFYNSLHDRTVVAAQLYLEADEISSNSLYKIKEKFINTLPDETIQVYDSTNKISFSKDTAAGWSEDVINEVRKRKYLAYRKGEKQVVGIYYEDNQGNFVIIASATDLYGKERKYKLLEILAALFGIQTLIQFAASRWFAQRALAPVQRFNAQVQKISATDLHLRLNTGSAADEFGTLAANFNNLLDRLEESFDLQKMFVANASHELKTPVTNIIGEIEVALINDRTNSDYRQNLQSVLFEAERLKNIIASFLLLANAETNGTERLAEPVRLDELLWDLHDEFSAQQGAQIKMQFSELPSDPMLLCIFGNKAMLTLAIRNVIQNAIKFSNGKSVTCGLKLESGAVVVSITDQGIGMGPEVLRNVFEPFFRAHTADEYPGHGIGLYIANKIVCLSGGSIEVTSQPGEGSVFNIIFRQNPSF